ncbi:hypothetical protein WJX77_009911 [Trebouxia sp. C0004]
MNVGHGATLSQKRIDQNSEPGRALQKVVQLKLKDFLGQDYADDVLPLYIVVMLAHGNQADLVADNLEAFLGQAPAQLFVQWLFQHLSESGEKYAAPDHEGNRSAASSSPDDSSAEKAGSEDGEASAVEEDETPQPSPEEAPHAQTEAQHPSQQTSVSQLQSNGVNRQETTERRFDRRSRHSPSPLRDRATEPSTSEHQPESHARNHDRRRSRETYGEHQATPKHVDGYWRRGRGETGFRDQHSQQHHAGPQDSSRFAQHGRYRSPARDYRHESTAYGDRNSRDAPRGHMRSRREGDSRDHYSQTDRDPKRQRSDPMRDDHMNGHTTERDDQDFRPQGSRMRADSIIAEAQQRRGQQHKQDMGSLSHRPTGPSVRSLVQRVRPARAEEEEQQDRTAIPRSRVQQPVRLFETAMRQVAAPSQPNKPSVFDRLTIQAAGGNSAAAVTASAVVRQLRQSAAATEGPDSRDILALKQQLKMMEQEVTKLRRQQQAVITDVASRPAAAAIATISNLGDCHSVVVHNVHFSATPQIVAAHFSGCGPTSRVTILKDSFTGHPSGTAYVQFLTSTQAAAALALTGSALLQRPITVAPKPPKPPASSHMSSFQYPSPRIAAAPFDPFGFQFSEAQYSANQYSGSGDWTPKGRGTGRSWRGGANSSRGGRSIATGGRGSEHNKSNVYIRPGLERQSK